MSTVGFGAEENDKMHFITTASSKNVPRFHLHSQKGGSSAGGSQQHLRCERKKKKKKKKLIHHTLKCVLFWNTNQKKQDKT